MFYQVAGLYKNAYTGLSKNSWYLSLVMFINRSGTMVIPFMTIYATQRLGFSVAEAGYIMALFGIGSIIGAYIGGRITDAVGFYPLQLAALFTGGMMFIVLGFLKTFSALAIGTFVLSVCNDSFRPANSAAVAFYSVPENVTRSYSLNRLAINLGWAFGGALGGFLASHNYHLLFWVDGLTNISAAFLLRFLLPKVDSLPPKTQTANSVAATSAYRDKPYLLFIFLTMLVGSCFFQMFTMQSLFYKIRWHFSEEFIGFLMAINGIIIGIVEMILIYRLDGTKPPLHFIRYGVLFIGIGYSLVNVLPPVAIVGILSVTIVTFGEMFTMPFMNTFWISRSTPANRGQYAALYTIAWSTAQIIAPTAGSQVAQHFGFTTLWWVILVVCILLAFAYGSLKKIL